MIWLGVAWFACSQHLLAKFILAMEAVHALLANFPRPIITLDSQKLHKWKRA
jgi:hypothetical protein